MENFASIVKGVTPEEMTGLLSSYLTPASQIITSYKGYIDKYEGHIIMADYGVPIPTGDHRLQCLYASIETQIDITAFKHHIYARTGKKVNTSMGVNTGFVSAGNMGSDKKMQYTIMGDTVNTAARFRPANWIYDYLGSVIIGESTYPYVKDIIQTRQLDRLLLKGKLKPVNIYQVLGWDPETYMNTRGHEDVTETLQVIWADHCPPEKIYGYQLLWEEQFERTQHPLCQELATFFASHIKDAAVLARITVCKDIQNNGQHHLDLQERVKELTGQELATIPDGNWHDKLHAWDKNVQDTMEYLSQQDSTPDLDKLKRDLLDVHEKIEALVERLEDDLPLPPELEQAWDQIKSYVETRFENDEEDYHELYTEKYELYQKPASELVESVSKRMNEYHTMMSQVGSMTEQQKQGCQTYQKALELHWERKWDESIAMFKKVLVDLPEDKAALSFIKRIEGYQTSPPPSTWQGEFAQTKK
jgi:class 3 adenylate cyclase